MIQIIDRETGEVITCAPQVDCPNNCITVVPEGFPLPPTPVPIPENYEYVYDGEGGIVNDEEGIPIYSLIVS